MAAQVNYPVASVTQDTHPFTYNCEFVPARVDTGLVTMEGFRNLLEAHIGTLNKAKQVSYTRNRAWLNAIRDGNTTPPAGYAGNRASWKNEIGATNPETSKWVVENGQVYKKDKKAMNGREEQPMTPTEGLYDLMTQIHNVYGHKGRDNFFNLVKQYSGSVKKAFCHQFVQVCCKEAESWQAGGHVPYGWQAPVKHRNAGEKVDEVVVVDNTNAAVSIQQYVSPQEMQQHNQQFGDEDIDFGDINFDEVDTQMAAANWNLGFQPTFHNYPTPPSSQGLGPEHDIASHFSPGQSPVAAQGPVDSQYVAADPQNLFDYQYPLPDQNHAVEPLQYALDFNNYMQNNPEFFQFAEDDVQMQMEDPYQMGVQNYDPNFGGQAAQEVAYYPPVEQQNPAIFDNEMILEQHDSFVANSDILTDETGQIMFNNQAAVGVPQILMVAADHSMQPAQNELENLASHLDFNNIGDSLFGDEDFNIGEFIDDPQMSL